MNRSSSSWAALVLLAPLGLIVALAFLPMGCGGGGGGGAPTPTPPLGFVQIGFVGSPTSGFQHILLNVRGVRVNPSSNPQVSPLDPNWRTINAPQGLGAQGLVQIDLTTAQDNAQLFNQVHLPAQTYQQVQLLLNQSDPGEIVPDCPQAPAVNEGCLAYPFVLAAGTTLRFSTRLNVSHHALAELLIDFDPGPILTPTSPGGVYTIMPTLKTQPASTLLGTITGTVTGAAPTVPVLVSAEPSGTNNRIAHAELIDGVYTLALPAAPSGSPPTLYDVAVSGPGVSYVAARGLGVTRGGTVTQNFSVTTGDTGRITGRISDLAGNAIQGATLNLLVAPVRSSGVSCKATPSQCVVVAATNSDDTGHYPLPGSTLHPAAFNIVPLASDYALQVKAAGYDSIAASAPVTVAEGNAVCGTPNISTIKCSFRLTSNTITGAVAVDTAPPAGADVQVLVMAEDAGTNQLENVTMTTIPSGATSAPYTLIVPKGVATFDLFASAQDFFDGAPSPFPGHTIEVLSGVAGGLSGQNFAPLQCVGHGSLNGVAVNPDSGTTVRLSKGDANGIPVQLMESQVVPAGAPGAGSFSFCAPPDNYTLQRYETGMPAPMSTPQPVTVPTPTPIATPCPSICSLPSGECPGLCVNTTVSPL